MRPDPRLRLFLATTRLIGLLHDVGKVSRAFARDLLDGGRRQALSHDLVGAALLRELVPLGSRDPSQAFLDTLAGPTLSTAFDEAWSGLTARASREGVRERVATRAPGTTATGVFRISRSSNETILGQVLLGVLTHHRLPAGDGPDIPFDGFVGRRACASERSWRETFALASLAGTPWRDGAWTDAVRTQATAVRAAMDEIGPEAAAGQSHAVETIGRLLVSWADHVASAAGTRTPSNGDAKAIHANAIRIVPASLGGSPFLLDGDPPRRGRSIPAEELANHLLAVARGIDAAHAVLSERDRGPGAFHVVHGRASHLPMGRTTVGVLGRSPTWGEALASRLDGNRSIAVTVGNRPAGHLRSGERLGDGTAMAEFHGGDAVAWLVPPVEASLPDALSLLCDREEDELQTTWSLSARTKLVADVLVRPIDELLRTADRSDGRYVVDLVRMATSDLVVADLPREGSARDAGMLRLIEWAGLLGGSVHVPATRDPETLLEVYERGTRARASIGLREPTIKTNVIASASVPIGDVVFLDGDPTSTILAWIAELEAHSARKGPRTGLVVSDDPAIMRRLEPALASRCMRTIFLNERRPPVLLWDDETMLRDRLERGASSDERTLVVIAAETCVPLWASGLDWTIVAYSDGDPVAGLDGGRTVRIVVGPETPIPGWGRPYPRWSRDGRLSTSPGTTSIAAWPDDAGRVSWTTTDRLARGKEGVVVRPPVPTDAEHRREDDLRLHESFERHARLLDIDASSSWDARRHAMAVATAIRVPSVAANESVGRQLILNLSMGCFDRIETGETVRSVEDSPRTTRKSQ